MDITLALLADSANISQEGKLNVLGSFNNINASTFPCLHPQMVLVMRFDASRAEIGQTKQLEIRLLDPDGAALGSVTGEFVVPDAPSGERVEISNILPIQQAIFPGAGPHNFAVMINGDVKAEIRLRITDTSQSEVTHDDNGS